MPGIMTSSRTMSTSCALTDGERFRAGTGAQHLVILGSQARLEQTHIRRNVVDDQNARSHITTPEKRTGPPA
jgi:hypothetical protein